MHIIPQDKFDMDAIKQIDTTSNIDLEPYLAELLIWVKDIDWPVARPIAKRLSLCGIELVHPIKTVLLSDDALWKYWVITEILVNLSKDVRACLVDDMVQLINNPSAVDREESVDKAAGDLMIMYSIGI